MTERPMPQILMAALVLASLTASPAAAQREPTDSALTYATAAYRSREPVSKVAPELRSKYRQSGEALTRTLLSAGYAAPEVASHLVSTDSEPAGATVAWLAGAGIDSRLAWDAVSRVTREPPETVAAEMMERIGPVTARLMVTWGRTFWTAGLSAGQVEGIYRRAGVSDPMQIAQALKDSGYNATETAEALIDMDADQIIAILIEIGFGDAEVAKAAKDALGLTFSQTLEALAAFDAGQALVPRAAATATEFGATAEEAAEALNAIGVVLTIIMIIVAVIVSIVALAGGLAALSTAHLITVLAVVLGLGTLPNEIAEVLHETQVAVERAAAALLANLPIDEATQAIREGYDASASATANALAAAGASWPDIIHAVFDNWDSFEATVGVVPSDLINTLDVNAVLFEILAASYEAANSEMVFYLMKAGMAPDIIAKGLRYTIGLDAAAIAQLFVDAGASSPTTIGFTQPLNVAQALKDAGFSSGQVQAALMAVFTLSMQQLGQILSAVFGG